MVKKQFNIAKKTLKKTLRICFLSSLTVTTIGFTMFGIGAGGRSTGVSQILKDDKKPVPAWVDQANTELAKFKTNTGFLTTKGKKMTADQVTASQALNKI